MAHERRDKHQGDEAQDLTERAELEDRSSVGTTPVGMGGGEVGLECGGGVARSGSVVKSHEQDGQGRMSHVISGSTYNLFQTVTHFETYTIL